MPTPEEIQEMEHQHVMLSYNQVDDLIYAGNNLCCQTHFEKELLAKGIAADISLEKGRLDNPHGVKYFFWFPWEEDTAPSVELITLAIKALRARYVVLKKAGVTQIICDFCAVAFNARKNLEANHVPLTAEYEGHPSIAKWIDQGYQLIIL